jgi:transposase
VIIRDDGGTHKGEPILALDSRFADRLAVKRLPPFAPALKPIESLWVG